jgi:hypothetical protein
VDQRELVERARRGEHDAFASLVEIDVATGIGHEVVLDVGSNVSWQRLAR